MEDKYTAVSCAFYDEFEAAAVRRIECTIVYKDENREKTVRARVIDFKTEDKQEFIILDNGQKIRLDKILLFNDLSPEDKNYC